VRGASGDTMEGAGAAWTHAQLGAAQRTFLDALPLEAAIGDTLLVHASADEPAAWHYVDNVPRVQRSLEAASAQGARRVFGGHVHAQRLYFEGMRGAPTPFDPTPGVAIPLAPHRRWLATIGSVGQPRDGDARAMYAIFDAAGARLTFHRVAYDHLAAAAAIRAAGLPAYFADRLGQGR
jgi:diadenosine tetraphosphatase ApaH/serine/threonine PP2A family protein phosphatase